MFDFAEKKKVQKVKNTYNETNGKYLFTVLYFGIVLLQIFCIIFIHTCEVCLICQVTSGTNINF